ncbi:unnamed protein product, partial [Mesorhabditis spiculigera]
MSLPWYYLEHATRRQLLKAYYWTCFLAYPAYVAVNYQRAIPTKQQVLGTRNLKEYVAPAEFKPHPQDFTPKKLYREGDAK